MRADENKGFNADYYLERPELDTRLHQEIENSQHVIITGKPLAGKSRAIYHLLTQHYPDHQVFFPVSESFSEDIKRLPKLCIQTTPAFFILDNLDEFVVDKQTKKAFDTLLAFEGGIIIAACRQSEWEMVKTLLEDSLSYITQLTVPTLTDDLKETLRFYTYRAKDISPADTVGSYFFPLTSMKVYYEKLVDLAKAGSPLEMELLRSYKCVEMAHKRKVGDKALIKEYATLRLQQYYGLLASDIPAPVHWDQAFNTLTQQGFIEQSFKKISIEPAYVIAQEEEERSLVKEIISYYPRIGVYNYLLNRTAEQEVIEFLYKNISQSTLLKPNVFTFSILINKSDSYSKAKKYYKKMKKVGVIANEVTFNSLINKAGSYEQAKEAYQLMQAAKVAANEVTFNSLINKAGSYEQAKEAYQLMQAAKVAANEVTFSTLINKAGSYEQAKEAYQLMQEAELVGDEVTFSTLINKAGSYEQAKEAYLLMQALNIKADAVTWTTLITKTETLDQLLAFCIKIRTEKPRLDNFFYKRLIKKCKTIHDVNKVLRHITEHFSVAWKIYTFLPKKYLRPNEKTFKILNRHANKEQAWDVYQEQQKYIREK